MTENIGRSSENVQGIIVTSRIVVCWLQCYSWLAVFTTGSGYGIRGRFCILISFYFRTRVMTFRLMELVRERSTNSWRSCTISSVLALTSPLIGPRKSSPDSHLQATMAESDTQGADYEAEHVHSVYEEIASHFSSTRYKVCVVTIRIQMRR
jgi:hypothetical protein